VADKPSNYTTNALRRIELRTVPPPLPFTVISNNYCFRRYRFCLLIRWLFSYGPYERQWKSNAKTGTRNGDNATGTVYGRRELRMSDSRGLRRRKKADDNEVSIGPEYRAVSREYRREYRAEKRAKSLRYRAGGALFKKKTSRGETRIELDGSLEPVAPGGHFFFPSRPFHRAFEPVGVTAGNDRP